MLFLLAPAVLLASGGENGGTDIIARSIHFVIFAAILYYLVAEPAKDFYKNRIKGIADRLNSIQIKVNDSLRAKEKAIARVDEAKVSAKSVIETAKVEAIQLEKKIVNDSALEIQNLEKSFQEKIEIERRKMTRKVIKDLLEEVFNENTISLDKDELIKIVLKKVA